MEVSGRRVCGLAEAYRTVSKVADFEFSKRGAKKFVRVTPNREIQQASVRFVVADQYRESSCPIIMADNYSVA